MFHPAPSPDFSSRLQSSFKRKSSSLRRPSAHHKAPPPSPIEGPTPEDEGPNCTPEAAEGGDHDHQQRPRASPVSATSVCVPVNPSSLLPCLPVGMTFLRDGLITILDEYATPYSILRLFWPDLSYKKYKYMYSKGNMKCLITFPKKASRNSSV